MSAVTPRGRSSIALPLQPAQLGYRPFEYWKGPRPVLPAAQKPFSALGGASDTHRPKAAAAAARITTTEIRLPGSGHPEQRPEPGPVRRSSSYYPNEKEASAHFAGRHPALQSPAAPTNMGRGPQAQGEGKAGPPSFQVHDATGPVELVTGSPPAYQRHSDHPHELPPRADMGYKYGVETPWWKQKRIWVTSLVLLVIAIVVAVVAGVLTSRASRYPDYTKLNYQLRDTCTSAARPVCIPSLLTRTACRLGRELLRPVRLLRGLRSGPGLCPLCAQGPRRAACKSAMGLFNAMEHG